MSSVIGLIGAWTRQNDLLAHSPRFQTEAYPVEDLIASTANATSQCSRAFTYN